MPSTYAYIVPVSGEGTQCARFPLLTTQLGALPYVTRVVLPTYLTYAYLSKKQTSFDVQNIYEDCQV